MPSTTKGMYLSSSSSPSSCSPFTELLSLPSRGETCESAKHENIAVIEDAVIVDCISADDQHCYSSPSSSSPSWSFVEKNMDIQRNKLTSMLQDKNVPIKEFRIEFMNFYRACYECSQLNEHFSAKLFNRYRELIIKCLYHGIPRSTYDENDPIAFIHETHREWLLLCENVHHYRKYLLRIAGIHEIKNWPTFHDMTEIIARQYIFNESRRYQYQNAILMMNMKNCSTVSSDDESSTYLAVDFIRVLRDELFASSKTTTSMRMMSQQEQQQQKQQSATTDDDVVVPKQIVSMIGERSTNTSPITEITEPPSKHHGEDSSSNHNNRYNDDAISWALSKASKDTCACSDAFSNPAEESLDDDDDDESTFRASQTSSISFLHGTSVRSSLINNQDGGDDIKQHMNIDNDSTIASSFYYGNDSSVEHDDITWCSKDSEAAIAVMHPLSFPPEDNATQNTAEGMKQVLKANKHDDGGGKENVSGGGEENRSMGFGDNSSCHSKVNSTSPSFIVTGDSVHQYDDDEDEKPSNGDGRAMEEEDDATIYSFQSEISSLFTEDNRPLVKIIFDVPILDKLKRRLESICKGTTSARNRRWKEMDESRLISCSSRCSTTLPHTIVVHRTPKRPAKTVKVSKPVVIATPTSTEPCSNERRAPLNVVNTSPTIAGATTAPAVSTEDMINIFKDFGGF